MLSFPKDNAQFSWTRHIKNKMVFYHLSGAQILRIFRKPKRIEEGIAPSTVAAMISRKPAPPSSRSRGISSRSPSEELWIMYRLARPAANGTGRVARSKAAPDHALRATRDARPSRVTMISAWRYPGITKSGERPTIPEDVLAELERIH